MAFCEAPIYSSATPVSNPPTSGNDVTQLLKRWRKGSRDAESELMERVQGELRRLAAGYLRHDRAGRTLQPTAVVNEAYIRLLPQRGVSWENRAHFFGIAAKMMRRVLVDHARTRRALKRGGAPVQVTLGEVDRIAAERGGEPTADAVDLLALDDALARLAALDPRKARLVELRYFGGLSIPECAAALGISQATVGREWSVARIWLRRELGA